jgi:hypothetical protein
MCEKNNVPLHHQAIPKDFSVEYGVHPIINISNSHLFREDPKQTTLDNFASKTPPFSSQGFLDYLVEMMVTEDDVRVIFFLYLSHSIGTNPGVYARRQRPIPAPSSILPTKSQRERYSASYEDAGGDLAAHQGC